MKKRRILIIVVVIAAILLLCPLPRRVNMAYSDVPVLVSMAYGDVPVLDNNGDIEEYMPTLTLKGYYLNFLVFPDYFSGKAITDDGMEYTSSFLLHFGQISRMDDYFSIGLSRDCPEGNHILYMYFYSDWSEVNISISDLH